MEYSSSQGYVHCDTGNKFPEISFHETSTNVHLNAQRRGKITYWV